MKYRIGRKQKRALLDENGLEVAFFRKGYEKIATEVCYLLNQKSSNITKSSIDKKWEIIFESLDKIKTK